MATTKTPTVKSAAQRPATTTAARSAAKPGLPAKGKASPVVKPVQATKLAKVKAPKPVRDRYTMPQADYAVLVQLKKRTVELKQPAKKNQLLRAGIQALAAMADSALLAALQAAPPVQR